MTESPPPQVGPVLQRWLTLLIELAKRLVSGPPNPEILTRLIEESVSVQVNNVANSEPVPKAWAGGVGLIPQTLVPQNGKRVG